MKEDTENKKSLEKVKKEKATKVTKNESTKTKNTEKEVSNKKELKEMIVTKETNDKKVKGSFVTGLIGAVIGGLIATIPWILMYVYGNMMLSALSIVIAAGEFYGYKLFNGKITKKLPITIMILAILIVALTTLVIIPAFLIMNEGVNVTIESIKTLYQNEQFSQAIIKDSIVAIVFTLLGASVITANIKRQLQNGNIDDIDLSNSKEAEALKKDAIKKIKPIFEKFNAMEKEHGILKDELNAEVEKDEELKTALNTLKAYKIVKKSSGRFYYSTESEDKQIKTKNKKTSKIVTILIAVLLVITMVAVVLLNQIGILNMDRISDGTVNFAVNGKWVSYQSYYTYSNAWNYYRFINTPAPQGNEEIDENDPTKWPAYLTVSYSTIDLEEMSSLEEVNESFKEYVNSLEEAPDIYEEEITKTENGYDILKIRLKFEQEPQQIEYLYYIMNGDMLASLDTYSYNVEDEQEIKATVENIAKTFKWE